MSVKVTHSCDVCGGTIANEFTQYGKLWTYSLVTFSVRQGRNGYGSVLCEGDICQSCLERIEEAAKTAVMEATGGNCKPHDFSALRERAEHPERGEA